MKKLSPAILFIFLLLYSCTGQEKEINELRRGFTEAPTEARPRALWTWVDGNFSLSEITREMEEARAKGLGGFDIWDVRKVMDEENLVPAGPAFMSPAYVEAIVHAISEAERLEMALGLIISSGWNAGGSWTLPEDQTMGLFTTDTLLRGPVSVSFHIDFPELPKSHGKGDREKRAIITRGEDGLPVYYKDLAVLALRMQDSVVTEVLDLSSGMDASGKLSCELPEGEWTLRRYVCTNTGQPMISSTPNSLGPMIDHFSAEASERHIRFFIDSLESALGKPIAESGLDYFYTDSYEVRGLLWTPLMIEEFEKRMGYSMLPYLPAVEGVIVDNEDITRRFLYDYRRLLSDLIIENHYARSREICEEEGIAFVAEAAGPGWPIHNCPFESLKSSGSLSFPRGEFWHLPSNNPYWKSEWGTEREHHFLYELDVIKGVASAAHIYDQTYVEAESFTGLHLWNEGPGDLKPTVDRAFAEGLNRIIFHTWPLTPESAGVPGWAYAFGTQISENRIWWPMAAPFMDYLGRCSYLLQQGEFHGDVLCYYGDSVPNFVPAKAPLNELGFGYDYDVCNSDIILNKLFVEDGQLKLPHGPVYEVLLLPDENYMQPEVLKRIIEFLDQGALVCGPKPQRSHGLHKYKERDSLVRALAGANWDRVCPPGELPARLAERIPVPDLQYSGEAAEEDMDFIHRRKGETDIYFLINKTDRLMEGTFTFRQQNKGVELWDPASGKFFHPGAAQGEHGTSVDLQLDAHASCFLVFSPELEESEAERDDWIPIALPEKELLITTRVLAGPIEVDFPVEADGPGRVVMEEPVLWNRHPDSSIQFFSGIATYHLSYEWEREAGLALLELEALHETARVLVNGQEAGIIWTKPWRLDITRQLKKGANEIEIEVANTWANALAWNARLAPEDRRTRTNVTRLPNAWTYPLNSLPREELGLLDSGIGGTISISHYQME